MKHILTGIGIGLVFLVAWLFLLAARSDDLGADAGAVTPEVPTTEPGLPQQVTPIDLTGPFSFAGEVIPVDNFDVRERLDAELLRNRLLPPLHPAAAQTDTPLLPHHRTHPGRGGPP